MVSLRQASSVFVIPSNHDRGCTGMAAGRPLLGHAATMQGAGHFRADRIARLGRPEGRPVCGPDWPLTPRAGSIDWQPRW